MPSPPSFKPQGATQPSVKGGERGLLYRILLALLSSSIASPVGVFAAAWAGGVLAAAGAHGDVTPSQTAAILAFASAAAGAIAFGVARMVLGGGWSLYGRQMALPFGTIGLLVGGGWWSLWTFFSVNHLYEQSSPFLFTAIMGTSWCSLAAVGAAVISVLVTWHAASKGGEPE
jgi:hypothetical protein